MISIYEKEELEQSDIEMIVRNIVEESIHIEFKSSDSLDNTDKNKSEISKDVSAFANSDGGLLIYGIKEIDHKADSYDFIDGRRTTKKWLENVIDSNIQRNIPDLRIFPIRWESKIEKTIYIIKIPESQLSPHMANDNRYYRRANYKRMPMEEYEIRNQYNKKLITRLVIDNIIVNGDGSASSGEKLKKMYYNFSIQIKNIGFAIEKDYEIEIQLHNEIYQSSNILSSPLPKYLIRTENDFRIFSIPNTSPIFQNEITTLITFPLTVTRNNFPVIKEFGFDLRLYYTSGTVEKQVEFSKQLNYKDATLTADDFS